MAAEGKHDPLSTTEQWYDRENQGRMLQQRLVALVLSHKGDTESGQDTSYTSHSLTIAHCDLVYWDGLVKVVDKAVAAGEPFAASMISLATVVRCSHCPLCTVLPYPALES